MDIMLDLETLGTEPGSVIIAIGAVEFSSIGIGRTFYKEINVDSSFKLGLKIDPATLSWWNNQGAPANFLVERCFKGQSPLVEVLQDFSKWLTDANPEGVKLWGNGSDFDNVLLQAAYKAAGLVYPVAYYNHRCFRTLKNLFSDEKLIPSGVGILHNALDDAVFQATWAINILNAIPSFACKIG